MEPLFFESPVEWRAWLEANHDTASDVWIGIRKARTRRPTVTWAQAVREALCFGWIDGQVRRIDDESHMQRFTPRKSRRWSAINVALVRELEAAGLMREAGRRAFAERDQDEEPYSVSKRPDQLRPTSTRDCGGTPRPQPSGTPLHPLTARWPPSMLRAPSARRRVRSGSRP